MARICFQFGLPQPISMSTAAQGFTTNVTDRFTLRLTS
jgi:hypothetical protein